MTEEIFVGIDGVRVKLEGEALQAFLAERQAEAEALAKAKADLLAKEEKRKNLLEKLGLTEDEAKLLLA